MVPGFLKRPHGVDLRCVARCKNTSSQNQVFPRKYLILGRVRRPHPSKDSNGSIWFPVRIPMDPYGSGTYQKQYRRVEVCKHQIAQNQVFPPDHLVLGRDFLILGRVRRPHPGKDSNGSIWFPVRIPMDPYGSQ